MTGDGSLSGFQIKTRQRTVPCLPVRPLSVNSELTKNGHGDIINTGKFTIYTMIICDR